MSASLLPAFSAHDPDVAEYSEFVDAHIAPNAGQFDRDEALPRELVRLLGSRHYLVGSLPLEAGGAGLSNRRLGHLHQSIGGGCASVRNLMAVQGMVAHTIHKWGSRKQDQRWTAAIASGEQLAAFALTEPQTGSDAGHISLSAIREGADFVLNGEKTWISFAAEADVFLVFARVTDGLGAFLIPRNTPGIDVVPMRGLLGLRASSVARLVFLDCRVAPECLLLSGPLTFGAVAMMALDYGRFSTACGCVGLAQNCLSQSLQYARDRVQFGQAIQGHQLVQRLLTDMVVGVGAARLQCEEAADYRDARHPDAVRRTLMAKYLSSTTAHRVASDAVQVHGANGCLADAAVQRHLRDAKVQEIIEGTSQIHQIEIARLTLALQN